MIIDHLCCCKPHIKKPIQQLLNKMLAFTKAITMITINTINMNTITMNTMNNITMNTITMTTMITCAVENPASRSLSNSC